MWESWGAIAEDGTISTYSYNRYVFGVVGDWMAWHNGGLQPIEPDDRSLRMKPRLTRTAVREDTPAALLLWHVIGDAVNIHVEVPVNTETVIKLPNMEPATVGRGCDDWLVSEV